MKTNLVKVVVNGKENNNQVVTTSRQVAETFGKEHKSVLEAIRNLTAEKSAVKNMFYETTYINERGREYPEYLINRDGFSLLVMGFTGDKALEFKLQYIEAFNAMEKQISDNLALYVPKNYKEALQALVEQEEKKEMLALELKSKELEIGELRPKADYADSILNNSSVVTATQISADYGLGVVTFNRLLHTLGIIYKVGDQWVLYSQYQGKGYTQSKTPKLSEKQRAQSTTHWTQKGRFFLHNLLTELGFYANVDMPEDYNPKSHADKFINGDHRKSM